MLWFYCCFYFYRCSNCPISYQQEILEVGSLKLVKMRAFTPEKSANTNQLFFPETSYHHLPPYYWHHVLYSLFYHYHEILVLWVKTHLMATSRGSMTLWQYIHIYFYIYILYFFDCHLKSILYLIQSENANGKSIP